MLSEEQIRRYREMDREERYAVFLELAAWAWKSLDEGGPEKARRRWELIRRQHDESSRRLEARFREIA